MNKRSKINSAIKVTLGCMLFASAVAGGAYAWNNQGDAKRIVASALTSVGVDVASTGRKQVQNTATPVRAPVGTDGVQRMPEPDIGGRSNDAENLKIANKRLSEYNSELLNELESAKSKIKALDAALEDKGSNVVVNNSSRQLVEDKEAVRKMLADAKRMKESARAEVANARRLSQRVRKELREKELQIDSEIFKRTKALTDESQRWKKESNKWAALAIQRKNETEILRKIAKNEVSDKELFARVLKAESDYALAKKTIDELEGRRDEQTARLTAELDNVRAENQSLKERSESMSAEAQMLRQELAEQEQQHISQVAEMEKLFRLQQQEKAEIREASAKQVAAAEKELVRSQRELESLQDESYQAQSTVYQLMNQNNELKSEVVSLEAKANEADKIREELLVARAGEEYATMTLNQLLREREASAMEADRLRSQISDEKIRSDNEIARLKERIKSAENEASSSTQQLKAQLAHTQRQSSLNLKALADAKDEIESKQSMLEKERTYRLQSDATKAQSNSTLKNSRSESSTNKSWYVKAASTEIAFIKHSETGKSLRVSLGFDVPGCGSVLSIDPGEQVVKTSKCVIAG